MEDNKRKVNLLWYMVHTHTPFHVIFIWGTINCQWRIHTHTHWSKSTFNKLPDD